MNKADVRANLKQDFDKNTVVDLLCARIDELREKNAELRERKSTMGRDLDQANRAVEKLLAEYGNLERENAELRERVEGLEEVLRRIERRFKREDDGAFLKDDRAGRIAWAMCRDAEAALSPKQEEEGEG